MAFPHFFFFTGAYLKIVSWDHLKPLTSWCPHGVTKWLPQTALHSRGGVLPQRVAPGPRWLWKWGIRREWPFHGGKMMMKHNETQNSGGHCSQINLENWKTPSCPRQMIYNVGVPSLCMYACMHVCVHACIACMHCTHIYIYICMYVCMYVM